MAANGTAPLSYQWTFNGGNISGATASTYTINSVQSVQAGGYAATVANMCGNVPSAGATLTVDVAPTITTQPRSQTVNQGANVTFSVAASGTAPLSYQWTFNGNNISGATASVFTINNVQTTAAGTYAVTAANMCGSVPSANASLTVILPTFTGLVNLDFGGATSSSKVGQAAVGRSASDFWNYLGPQEPGPIANLLNADGTISPVSVTMANLNSAGTDGSSDPMYNGYVFGPQTQNGTLTLNNLPAGNYSVFAYSYDGSFSLSAGGTPYGSVTTEYNKPPANPAPWVPWLHYAWWTNAALAANQSLVLTVQPGLHDGYPVICGLQVAELDSDGSGLPVSWEMEYFGQTGVNPSGDPTNDGLSNFQDYIMGGNPNFAAVPDPGGTISLQVFTPLH
ncbi:MAG: immunoglobulin domain-containing protein [Limisphaerales bacterium]